MKKRIKWFWLLLLLMPFAYGINGRVAPQAQSGKAVVTAKPQTAQTQNTAGKKSETVDFEADVMRPIKLGDSSVLSLVGHVVFYHNGAVITCDSAIRYSDKRMDCFQNVIINQQTTYIYGDRADYDGFINTARVYAPIVKMVDKDATLYTYNFSFNTLDKVGRFSGGGTMMQGDNLLESRDGYYYSDTRTVVCVRDVETQNPEYMMKADSVTYDMNSEVATFYTRSYIWNDQQELLTAKRGKYDRPNTLYTFTEDSYVLTKTQEIWADSITYNQTTGDALLLNRVQVRDEDQKAIAFGDFLQYWGERQNALLTRDPALVSYDPKEDTLYMRSDTMFLYTLPKNAAVVADSAAILIDSLADSSTESLASQGVAQDTAFVVADSVRVTEKSETVLEREVTLTEPAPVPPTQLQMEESLDTAPQADLPQTRKQRRKQRDREQEVVEKVVDAEKTASKETDEPVRADRSAVREAVEEHGVTEVGSVAVEQREVQEKVETIEGMALIECDSLQAKPAANDSLQRVVHAYRNVRIFRNDFQAVCDSMVAFSLDSTVHLYIDPVVWNGDNQVKSTVIDIYTKNQLIDRAHFVGEPIMSSEIDTTHYNQVKGKTITAYFKEGKMDRADVRGNGQTYYYMEEGDSISKEIIGFLTAECANITFYFADQQIRSIVWKEDPVYAIYPLDKIPEDQPLVLKGFVWEGDRKPTQEQVFTRTITPSERERFEALPKPLYPITEGINAARKQFEKDGIWRDRIDTISPEAQDFIRDITNPN